MANTPKVVSKIEIIPVEDFLQFHKHPKNPRVTLGKDIRDMAESILANGLIVRPVVRITPDGHTQILRGHRRHEAMLLAKQLDPERFNEKFKDGLEVEFRSGMTEGEAIRFLLDHENVLGLESEAEIFNAASALFSVGASEEEVANRLHDMFEKTGFSRFTAARRENWKKLTTQLDLARRHNDDALIAETEKAMRKEMNDAHRGYVQKLSKINRAPEIVKAAMIHKATGQNPAGFEGHYLPDLTNKQLDNLLAAYEKDVQSIDTRVTLPEFNKLWSRFVEAEKKKSGTPVVTPTRPKSVASSELAKEANAYKSIFARVLTKKHAGLGVEVPDYDFNAEDHAIDLMERMRASDNETDSQLVTDFFARGEELLEAEKQKGRDAGAQALSEEQTAA